MSDTVREMYAASRMPGPADPWPLRRDLIVMVIDSSADRRDIYGCWLEEAGYAVETMDGTEAVAIAQKKMPDVIVLSAAGDRDETVSLAQKLNANPLTCAVPILLIVPEGASLDSPGALESAVDDCLVQPTQHWELLMRVRSMTRLRQHRLELLDGRSLHGEQSRMWGVLLEFTRAVARIGNLDDLQAQIVHTAAEMTCSRRVSLMLPDEKQEFLTIAKSLGLDDAMTANVRVPIGEAVSGEAFRTGRPVTTLERHESAAGRKGFDFNAFVSMPMIYTTMSMVHQRVGVLNVSNRYVDLPFEEWELEFIDLLASMAGSAIDDYHSRDSRESLLRMERDLQLARQIQRNTFPKVLPIIKGFEIHAWSDPADETAGDTYDVIGCGDGADGATTGTEDSADRVLLLLADATGHGIGPALSVTQVRAMLRMAVRMETDLAQIARHLNEQLVVDLPDGRFVTAWLGELDATSSVVTSFSAGQAPILRYDAGEDRVAILPADTMPFGIRAPLEISIADPIPMNPGDILAVLSDGLFEAKDRRGRQFGIERVIELLRRHRHESPKQIHRALRHGMDEFTVGVAASDDQTGIIVKRSEA